MITPLLIVMTPVRNEAWVLHAFLKSTSLWADYTRLKAEFTEMWSWIKNASEDNSTLYFDEAGHFKVKVKAPISVDPATGNIQMDVKADGGLITDENGNLMLNLNSTLETDSQGKLGTVLTYEEVTNG